MLDFASRNRAHLSPWEPLRSPDYWSLQYWQRQLESSHDEIRRGVGLRTVFVEREAPDGAIIGVANLSQICRGAFLSSMLGYSIDADHQGHGLMQEALRALIGFAFDGIVGLGLHRIQANYRPENARSKRLLDALGFEQEGFARDYLFIDGAWRDHVLTAKLAPRP